MSSAGHQLVFLHHFGGSSRSWREVMARLPGFPSWLQSGSCENIAARMERISVPTLVVAGQCDAAMTPDLLRREVVERLANARLEAVAGAAHLLPLEVPEAIAALIRRAVLNPHLEVAA